MSEQLLNHDTFWKRPSNEVVEELAEKVYVPTEDQPEVRPNEGYRGWNVEVPRAGGGVRSYRVEVAEAYDGSSPNKTWRTLVPEIEAMDTGTVFIRGYRTSVMPFVKTAGADNVLVRRVVNIETEQVYANPKQVSQEWGVAIGDRGRLRLDVDRDPPVFVLEMNDEVGL